MQQARCYLLGERAVVLELSPPVTLHTQQRIWGLTAQLLDCVEVSEAIPGMNNITVILREPQQMTLQAVAWLQEWWEKARCRKSSRVRQRSQWSMVVVPGLIYRRLPGTAD